MKYFLIFICLLVSLSACAQTGKKRINLRDDLQIFKQSGSPILNGFITTDVDGKAMYITKNQAKTILEIPEISTNIFTGNQSGIADRSHTGNGFDMIFDDMGDFTIKSSTLGKSILFEKSNGGNTPIQSLRLTDDAIEWNSDDGFNISSLTIGDNFIFANSNGQYQFDNFFNPIPFDTSLTNLLTINGEGFLRQTDLTTLLGGGSDNIYEITDSLCFIITGDTTCVELDSVVYYYNEVCFIEAGDTTCVPWVSSMINIFNSNGALPENRLLEGHEFSLTTRFNGLTNGGGLIVSSNNTGASGNTQRLFQSILTGANATPSQQTAAGYFSNSHTGTSPVNYGIYTTVTGNTPSAAIRAESASSAISGYFNNSSSGNAVFANSFSGTGVVAQSSTNNALTAGSGSGIAGVFNTTSGSNVIFLGANTSSGSTIQSMMTLQRSSSAAVSDGIGASIVFNLEPSNGTANMANTLKSYYTTITSGSEVSRFAIQGRSGFAIPDIIYFDGDGSTIFNGRAQEKQGANIASTSGAMTLGGDGNVFQITGTNTITHISSTGWQLGSVIYLAFQSTATLQDGNANSGSDAGIELSANANFTATPGDVIELVYVLVGADAKWRQPK